MSSKVAYLLLFSKVNNILIVRNNNLIGLISLTGVSFKLFPAQQTVDFSLRRRGLRSSCVDPQP